MNRTKSTNSKLRIRTTIQQDQFYQQQYLSLFQETYDELQVVNVKNAILQFKYQIGKSDKRKFDWFRLDKLIGRDTESYEKKTFSYKYVNEVLYKRYLGKTSKQLRVFVKQSAGAEFEVMKQSKDIKNQSLEDLKKELVTRVQKKIQKNEKCLAKYDKKVVHDTLQKFSDEIMIFAPSPKELSTCFEDLQIEFRHFDESDE
ncbi:Hypothetical_protein [Hexamita inflata]|uniref:Hypothetical_protein n=1 Tax=Hexamita inflata TaxID=28002 RepID=A0AA86PWA1_9EUKA|nr:Hypothetical protein HINF_LOCUS34836 [Hexamita inflata]